MAATWLSHDSGNRHSVHSSYKVGKERMADQMYHICVTGEMHPYESPVLFDILTRVGHVW
ncbi:MAG: hypothetical protein ACW98Y_09800 [Candidatus Thorarchaeota archaeon]